MVYRRFCRALQVGLHGSSGGLGKSQCLKLVLLSLLGSCGLLMPKDQVDVLVIVLLNLFLTLLFIIKYQQAGVLGFWGFGFLASSSYGLS